MKIICITKTIKNITINILLCVILSNKLYLSVLALKALNIPIKTNKAKNAVIKYLLSTSKRIKSLKNGIFKKSKHKIEE